jgi:hypothetical protein
MIYVDFAFNLLSWRGELLSFVELLLGREVDVVWGPVVGE